MSCESLYTEIVHTETERVHRCVWNDDSYEQYVNNINGIGVTDQLDGLLESIALANIDQCAESIVIDLHNVILTAAVQCGKEIKIDVNSNEFKNSNPEL